MPHILRRTCFRFLGTGGLPDSGLLLPPASYDDGSALVFLLHQACLWGENKAMMARRKRKNDKSTLPASNTIVL
jgi:hypothetical protein